MLLLEKKPAEAELKLRECLTIRQKIQPDDWTTFDTESILGEALLDQKKFADAEPLLLSGYEGMKQREDTIPSQDKPHLTQALERLVRLYEAWGKPDKAAKWRKDAASGRGDAESLTIPALHHDRRDPSRAVPRNNPGQPAKSLSSGPPFPVDKSPDPALSGRPTPRSRRDSVRALRDGAMGRSAWAGMLAAALLLACVGLAPCAAQPPGLPPPPPPVVRAAGGRAAAVGLADGHGPAPERRRGDVGPEPARHHPEARGGAAGADRPPLPDQPGDRAAALRRPADHRGRGAGQRLGRRGRPPAGPGPLAPDAQFRLRLHPPRRRRPRLQQGHLDRGQHELLLRRCRPDWGSQLGIISTTDAIFQPLVARQVLNARHWDIQSAKNDALMQTADAYFMVHQHRGMYAGTLYCVERGHELVERIATLSRDLVPEFEVERARNMVADLEQRAVTARQQWRVQQRRPDAGPAARPPRRRRADGARPPADHPDRPRPRRWRT